MAVTGIAYSDVPVQASATGKTTTGPEKLPREMARKETG